MKSIVIASFAVFLMIGNMEKKDKEQRIKAKVDILIKMYLCTQKASLESLINSLLETIKASK